MTNQEILQQIKNLIDQLDTLYFTNEMRMDIYLLNTNLHELNAKLYGKMI